MYGKKNDITKYTRNLTSISVILVNKNKSLKKNRKERKRARERKLNIIILLWSLYCRNATLNTCYIPESKRKKEGKPFHLSYFIYLYTPAKKRKEKRTMLPAHTHVIFSTSYKLV